jgi:hypothetical protein
MATGIIHTLDFGPLKILDNNSFYIVNILDIPTVYDNIHNSTPPSGLSLSDNFNTYTVGSLSGQGNWTNVQGNMTVVDVSGNKEVNASTTVDTLIKRTETFTNDHSSQVTIKAISGSSWTGVTVRTKLIGGIPYGYYYYAGNGDRYLEVLSPSYSNIASSYGNTNNPGDILKMEIVGTTLKCYYNGVLDTSLNGTGIFTTTHITTGGTPGIYGYNSGTLVDDWIGLDI